MLEFVATSLRSLMVKDVAQGLGLNLTTTNHLVNMLESRGGIHKEVDGTLHIGTGAGVLHRAMRTGNSSTNLTRFVHNLRMKVLSA